MGTVSQGTVTRSETYNYPLTPNYSLIDAPTYSEKIESWTRDGTNFDSATTNYFVDENATPRVTMAPQRAATPALPASLPPLRAFAPPRLPPLRHSNFVIRI